MAKINYDSINFKNKDVDKFTTKFGNGDPLKKVNNTAAADKTALNKPAAIVTKDTYLADKQKSTTEKLADKFVEGYTAPAKYVVSKLKK